MQEMTAVRLSYVNHLPVFMVICEMYSVTRRGEPLSGEWPSGATHKRQNFVLSDDACTFKKSVRQQDRLLRRERNVRLTRFSLVGVQA